MAILAYDHNMIGAPELLVPGMKPVGPVTLNQGNIIADNLYSWWPFHKSQQAIEAQKRDGYTIQWVSGGNDFTGNQPIHGYFFDKSDEPTIVSRNGDTAAYFNRSGSYDKAYTNDIGWYSYADIDVTFAVIIEFIDLTNGAGIIGNQSLSGQDGKYGQGMFISNVDGKLYGNRSSGNLAHRVGITAPSIGKKVFLVFTISGTTGSLYVDGVFQASGTVNSTSFKNTTYRTAVGTDGAVPNQTAPVNALDGYVYGAWVLTTHLTPGQVMDWHIYPYQFLKGI
jgi:hypothetical protein